MQTRVISRVPSPVSPGVGQPLPMSAGRARTWQRCWQLSAHAQPNEEQVTHAMSSSSWPCSRKQSREAGVGGAAGGSCSPAALAGRRWAQGHPRDPCHPSPSGDSGCRQPGRGQAGPQELDPGLQAQRYPSPGETEAQGELQMSRRTQQLMQLRLREEAEATVKSFLKAREVWQCRRG